MSTSAPIYWTDTNGQKMTFQPVGGLSYTLSRNPTIYTPHPATMASLDVPVTVGASILNGGLEYAPQQIDLKWDELNYSEYQYLAQNVHMTFGKMIDHVDNAYYGWLNLGQFNWQINSAMVGTCDAIFMAVMPADGYQSVVNKIASPLGSGITATTSGGGGALSAGSTFYYWLTFFSNWGETLPYAFSVTNSNSNGYNVFSWTPPTTGFYYKARLYVSASSDPIATIPYVAAEVLAAQTQTFTDYSGTAGKFNQSPLPILNLAATGRFAGGLWMNLN